MIPVPTESDMAHYDTAIGHECTACNSVRAWLDRVTEEAARKVPRMPGDPDWKPCPDISGSLC